MPASPETIDGLPVFAKLTPEQRAEVAACAGEIAVETGEPVIPEGDFAYHFFVIEEGTAEVRQDGAVLRTLGPGDVFGEIGLLVTGRRTASVVATSPLRLLIVFDQDFRRLEKTMPEFAAAVRGAAADRL
jgi:CRP-like cAMP-binding protein